MNAKEQVSRCRMNFFDFVIELLGPVDVDVDVGIRNAKCRVLVVPRVGEKFFSIMIADSLRLLFCDHVDPILAALATGFRLRFTRLPATLRFHIFFRSKQTLSISSRRRVAFVCECMRQVCARSTRLSGHRIEFPPKSATQTLSLGAAIYDDMPITTL